MSPTHKFIVVIASRCRQVPQYLDEFFIPEIGYLVALGRRHLNPELKSLCPWYNWLVNLKSFLHERTTRF